MKRHTVSGDRLGGEMRSLRRVRPIVRPLYERLDGRGYADALRGDAIPLVEPITGIADVFDALTTARLCTAARPVERAYEELPCQAACGWRRRDLVEAFIRLGHSEELAFGQIGRFSALSA